MRMMLLGFLLAAVSPAALAASLEQLQAIEDAQHAFVIDNGGAAAQELDIIGAIAPGALGNFALIDQIEGTGMRAEVTQGGTDNVVMLLQGFGDLNEAHVDQHDTGNLAFITQAGVANLVTLLNQSGDGNSASLFQQGDSNLASVTQINGLNRLTLRQLDGFNSADIEQNGNTELTVTQTNAGGSSLATNQLLLRAWSEPGASPGFLPIGLDGPGSTQLYLCNGSPGYCSAVLPP